jgi:neutral amino acid transport system permease protein
MEAAEAGAEKQQGTLSGLGTRVSLSPAAIAGLIVAAIAVALIVTQGLQPFGQTTVNGLISASYFALGAVGLTLVYGTLKLVNFAHGDLLTLGAYVAFVANVSLGLPILVAVLCSVAGVAAFGVATERVMWRPMRAKGAGLLQLLIMTLGLAFVIRYTIQLFAGTQPRSLQVDITSSTSFIGLTIGQTQLIVVIVGFASRRWASRCAPCRTTSSWPRWRASTPTASCWPRGSSPPAWPAWPGCSTPRPSAT